MRTLPLRYVAGCGVLFVAYSLLLFLALGLAKSRKQVLEVGLLNYLWPALTILLSVVLLKKRASRLLFPATLLALSGVFLVLTQGAQVSWQSFARNLAGNPIAYSLGLGAAVSWAFYSVFARRWAGGERKGAVDLFLPATGGVLLSGLLLRGRTARVGPWLAYGSRRVGSGNLPGVRAVGHCDENRKHRAGRRWFLLDTLLLHRRKLRVPDHPDTAAAVGRMWHACDWVAA